MSARLRVGLIGSGDNNTNTLLRLLVEQGIHIVFTLTPKDIAETHINEKNLDVWLLDLDDAHWHNNLDELMDRSNVPIFFNEHQSIEQQTHVEYWVRNLISRMEELADDIEMPNTPSAAPEKSTESAARKKPSVESLASTSPARDTSTTEKAPPATTTRAVTITSAPGATTASGTSTRNADANRGSSKTAEMHHIAFNAPPALPSDQLTPMPTKVDADLLREMEELESFLLDKDPAEKVDSFKPLEPIRLQVKPRSEEKTTEVRAADPGVASTPANSKTTTSATMPAPATVAPVTVTPTTPESVSTKPTTEKVTSATAKVTPSELSKTNEPKNEIAHEQKIPELAAKPIATTVESNKRAVAPASPSKDNSSIAADTEASLPATAKAEVKTEALVVPAQTTTPNQHSATRAALSADGAKPATVSPASKVDSQVSDARTAALKKESIEDLIKAAKSELRGQVAPVTARAEASSATSNAAVTKAEETKAEEIKTETSKSESAKVAVEKQEATNSPEVKSSEIKSSEIKSAEIKSESANHVGASAAPYMADSESKAPAPVKAPPTTPETPVKAQEEQIILPNFELDLGFIDESEIAQSELAAVPAVAQDVETLQLDAELNVTLDDSAIKSDTTFELPVGDEDNIPSLALDAVVDLSYESIDETPIPATEEFELLPTLTIANLESDAFEAMAFEPTTTAPATPLSATVIESSHESTPVDEALLIDDVDAEMFVEETTIAEPAAVPEIELAVPMLESVAIGAEFEELAPFKPNETPIVAKKKLPCDLWIVGASLGGPAALKRFFGSISEPLPVCFLIAQHIDPHFLPVLGKIVEGANPFYKVEVLTRPGLIEPGTILLAPVEKRLWFLDGAQVVHSPHSWTPPYSPSINDVLLDVAKAYPSQTHTVIFSGMGEDGVDGAKSIHQAGGHVWVQESESCASAVMPDAIFNTGIVSLRDTPEKLAQALMKRYLDKSQSQHG